ncbi:hypothetical protein C7974DRAFT_215892 [Boeremia exigua]|uniref:uncharacterized protein n=1 Tax=Boeremia exigua TaxID=749465 RepID=UPI001E8E8A1F|nr:uncharacterized protein C7974DRAFT_215892 [Boeremia exigua]KAH6622088.1 hypothetical protein C7974DRAFT_215892 [Boeremia exigua]
MIFPLLIAGFAAVSTAQSIVSVSPCQEVTETLTECRTSYSEFAAPTGVSIQTASFTTTFNYSISITSTTYETVTVTPAATTNFIGVVNVTSTFTTTVTSVPAATTIPSPKGFFPIINTGIAVAPTPTPSAIGRHRRASIESRAEHLQRVKRLPETPAGNTVGFIVFENGEAQSLRRTFPVFVECHYTVNINSTVTTIVAGPPQTEVLVPATATAASTSTVSVTETVIEIDAQPTEYAACQANNVVNNVIGFDNQPIYFDRVIYASDIGFPIANVLVVDILSPVDCCIACQKTPFCAGSFYAPSVPACYLQLTQAPPSSSSSSSLPSLPSATLLPPYPLASANTSLPYPTASGAPYPAGNDTLAYFPTATALATGFTTLTPIATPISDPEDGMMSILPISAVPTTGTLDSPGAGTCAVGSLSLYLGKVYGQVGFPPGVALWVSNGPCGRMGIDFDEAAPVKPEDLKPLVARRFVGSTLI